MEASTFLICPECGSSKAFKDGKRKLADGETTQRYICRDCGFRYSYPCYNSLNNNQSQLGNSRISAKAKNMVFAQKNKFCAEDTKLPLETQGLLAQFYSYLEKNAYSEATEYPKKIKRLAKLGANLYDPENVKETIAKLTFKDLKTGETKKAKNGTKNFYCAAYTALAAMLKIQWENPGYKQEEIEVYVPYESELDALINAAHSRRMAAFLQTLKETYADPSEALRIQWKDIDEKNSTIAINYPVKNHRSGTLPVSAKLLSMISALPHKNERVFPHSYRSMYVTFNKLRKRVSTIQQNPRILAVEMRGFRHWGGTKIAFDTNGNHLEVKRLLRHKTLGSTEKYIGKIDFKTDDFDTTSATSLDDILRLGSSGWIEYSVVKNNGIEYHCFKKPKRFQSNV